MTFFQQIIAGALTLYSLLGGNNFGATIITTNLSDTIGTFRTNVNTSLTNLNNALTSVTSSLPTSIVGSTYIGVSAPTGTVTLTNNGVQSLTATAGIGLSSATGTITVSNNGVQSLSASSGSALSLTNSTGTIVITNNGVTSTIAGTNITLSSATGTVTINTTTTPTFTNVKLTDTSNPVVYGEKNLCGSLMFVYSTSSNQWFDDCIIGTTSTITSVIVKNQSNADFLTWNLYYNNTMPQATTTSGFKVFAADQTTNTTTTANLVPTASTTPNGMDFIRIFVYNASSSEFSITIKGKDR